MAQLRAQPLRRAARQRLQQRGRCRQSGHRLTGRAVCSGRYPPLPERLSPAVRDLLGRMLVVDVERRILLEEIVSHEWYLASVDGNGDRNFRVRSPPPSPTAPAAAISTSTSVWRSYAVPPHAQSTVG